jgi:hypothetical protein
MKKSLLTIAVVIAASGVRAADYRTGRDGPQTARAGQLAGGYYASGYDEKMPVGAFDPSDVPGCVYFDYSANLGWRFAGSSSPSIARTGFGYDVKTLSRNECEAFGFIQFPAGVPATCLCGDKVMRGMTGYTVNGYRAIGTTQAELNVSIRTGANGALNIYALDGITLLATHDLPVERAGEARLKACAIFQIGTDGRWAFIQDHTPISQAPFGYNARILSRQELESYNYASFMAGTKNVGICGDEVTRVVSKGMNSSGGNSVLRLEVKGYDIGHGLADYKVSVRTATDGSLALFDRSGDKLLATYNQNTGVGNLNPTSAPELLPIQDQNSVNPDSINLIASAREVCADISDGIDKIKIAAGISVGAGAVGTLAVGASAAVGFINENSKPILKITLAGAATESKEIIIGDSANGSIKQAVSIAAKDDSAKTAGAITAAINGNADFPFTAKSDGALLTVTAKEKDFLFDQDYVKGLVDQLPAGITAEAQYADKSGVLATVRTAGSFVAGGTQAVAAVSSFIGGAGLDKLAKDMNSCSAIVREIGADLMRRRIETPDDPSIEQMAKISDSCKGLNTKNITDIKKAMISSGILSTVGAAAGIAGGVASVAANKNDFGAAPAAGIDGGQAGAENNVAPVVAAANDESKYLTLATNIMLVASGATSLIGTIISGTVLANLNKNGEIAAKCRDAF